MGPVASSRVSTVFQIRVWQAKQAPIHGLQSLRVGFQGSGALLTAIIQLPGQSTTTILSAWTLPRSLPQAKGSRKTFRLHQLRAINVVLQGIMGIGNVLNEIRGESSLTTGSFVVEVDGQRLRMSLRVLFTFQQITVNCLEGWKSCHAEFSYKTTTKFVPILVAFLTTVPDYS